MTIDYPDFEGNKQALMERPDWAAVVGLDKNFYTYSMVAKASMTSIMVAYTVPVGKTLYITHFSGASYGFGIADRDLNQMCEIEIWDTVKAAFIFFQGGNGGAGGILATPLVFVAGTLVEFYLVNRSAHDVALLLAVGGFET